MKCATVGCQNTPVVAMLWDESERYTVENVCQECFDSYSRRPWLVARVKFAPMVSA